MKSNRRIVIRWILAILYVCLGATLIVCNAFEVIDSFWSGMGTAFAFIGVLQILRLIRYKTNQQYKEKVETESKDERNRFLSTKAWSWAGYLYVMIAAIATIVFKLLNQETLMFAASGSVCLIVILYWLSYLVIRKKY